jgi:hypothetical protein
MENKILLLQADSRAVQIRLFRSLLNLLLCYIYVMFFNAIFYFNKMLMILFQLVWLV